MKTNIFFAYTVMWIAVSVAVIAGLIITQNTNCLWAFLIPGLIKLKTSSEDNDDEEDDNE